MQRRCLFLKKGLIIKRKSCEQIKELRSKIEVAKAHFSHTAETDNLISVVKQLETELKMEEQLIEEEARIRAQLSNHPDSWAAVEAEVLAHKERSAFRSLIKPVLAFAAGAGVLALLHWRKIITIPQVA